MGKLAVFMRRIGMCCPAVREKKKVRKTGGGHGKKEVGKFGYLCRQNACYAVYNGNIQAKDCNAGGHAGRVWRGRTVDYPAS